VKYPVDLSSLLLLTQKGAILEHHVFILLIASPQEKMLSGLAYPVKPHLPYQLFPISPNISAKSEVVWEVWSLF